jgi:alanine dehydrogenase
MIVGVPKEIKVHESRVAITPEGVSEFVHAGHSVIIEDKAGVGSSITNEDFMTAGATMPGAVPVASTYALTNATLPFALSLANLGWKAACEKDESLAKGLNVHEGKIYYSAVAEAHGYATTQL